MPLSEHQWEITSPDGDSLVFGTLDTGLLTLTRPDLGQREIRDNDSALPREDGTGMGLGFRGKRSVTFEIGALHASHRAHLDALDALEAMWYHPSWRNEEFVVGVLRSHAAGRERIAYGRPRRYAEADGNLTHEGFTSVVAEFAIADGLWYDAEERAASMGLPSSAEIGFATPIRSPLQTLSNHESEAMVTVTGQHTWPVIEIHGPVVLPAVYLGEHRIALSTNIGDDETITIDPRPWSRGVYRNDGANYAGALTWDSPPLAEIRLDPGTYPIQLRGTDATGTAWCQVRWRNAHTRP